MYLIAIYYKSTASLFSKTAKGLKHRAVLFICQWQESNLFFSGGAAIGQFQGQEKEMNFDEKMADWVANLLGAHNSCGIFVSQCIKLQWNDFILWKQNNVCSYL